MDDEARRAAVTSRDPRFDGRFVHAVTSTGIYCRPSCPARTPAARHSRFFASAAAAQAAGFRACKRCRPDASPGSPEWDARGDLTARAMRLIGDGLVERAGVPGLAAALGYSSRQLERVLLAELGAGPLALAAATRVRTARTLIESTDLRLADVAHAAGYGSIRSFNDAIATTYATTPGALRVAARGRRRDVHRGSGGHGSGGHGSGSVRSGGVGSGAAGGTVAHAADVGPTLRTQVPGPGTQTAVTGPVWTGLDVRLAYRAPLDPSNLYGHLVATAVPGVEEWRDGAFRSTVALPHGPGIVAAGLPHGGVVPVRLHLADVRDLPAAVARTRRLLDLDADPAAVDEALAGDPRLAPLVAAAPGRRVPHTLDPAAMALRAVLGQQVSTAAARTHAARLVVGLGTPVDDPDGGLTHLFPTASALVDDPSRTVAALAMPATRVRTVLALAGALADGLDLGPGADWAAARAALAALPGVGPWTVETVAMRALGDPDAFLPGDLGVRRALDALHLRPADATAWSPWRAYAVQHLWALRPHPVNRLPEDQP